MGPLGLVLVWGGYLFGIWGFSKLKSAYNPAGALSLPDLALPSHRGAYMAAVSSWGQSAGPGSTPPSSPGAQAGPPNTPGQPPVQMITPTTPGGNSGVDLNGNHYTRNCSTCPWQIVSTGSGGPVVYQ